MNKFWLVGHEAGSPKIWIYDLVADSWTDVSPAIPGFVSYIGVWGSSEKDIWASCAGVGKVAHSKNGTTWTSITLPTSTKGWNCISNPNGCATNDIYVVNDYTVQHYDGLRWSNVGDIPGNAIWMELGRTFCLDTNHVYLAGYPEVPGTPSLCYGNARDGWTIDTTSPKEDVFMIDGNHPNNLYILTKTFKLYYGRVGSWTLLGTVGNNFASVDLLKPLWVDPYRDFVWAGGYWPAAVSTVRLYINKSLAATHNLAGFPWGWGVGTVRGLDYNKVIATLGWGNPALAYWNGAAWVYRNPGAHIFEVWDSWGCIPFPYGQGGMPTDTIKLGDTFFNPS